MTGIRFKDRETEEADVTYAPTVIAFGLLVAALTLTLWPPGAIAALLIITTGIVLWVRESVKANRDLVPSEVRRGYPEAFGLRTPTVYWWGAAGFGTIQLVVSGAAMRAAHAHGLLDPDLPPVPTMAWVGHLAMALLVVTSIVGLWAARKASDDEHRPPLALAFSLFFVGMLVHLGLVLLQIALFFQDGFFPGDRAAASAAGWAFAVHSVFVFGAIVAMTLFLVRMRLGALHRGRFGLGPALVLFWWMLGVSWVLIYAAFYLGIIRIGSYLI